MTLDDIRALPSLDRFLYWCSERESIAHRKRVGLFPLTDDPILATYRFTNVFREDDKTTVWFRDTVREPLKSHPNVVFATIAFRWFNFIPTGEVLWKRGLLVEWNQSEAERLLRARRERGEQVFTGAYMINSPPGHQKLEYICGCINNVWLDVDDLKRRSRKWRTMAEAHEDLQRYERIGGFMSYEIVCDLRYTDILKDATDANTWAHLGPGARRGLLRVMGRPIETKKSHGLTLVPLPYGWEMVMRQLRAWMEMEPWAKDRRVEMREVEQSLCEYDKYCRTLFNEGQLKRRYP